MSASDWTEEAVGLATKLKREGFGPAEIARFLRARGFDFSNSAVIGKLDRLERAEMDAANIAEPWRPSLEDRPDWLRFNLQPIEKRKAA
jgi:hypothetical protein